MILIFDNNRGSGFIHHLIGDGKDGGFGSGNGLFGTTKSDGGGGAVVF